MLRHKDLVRGIEGASLEGALLDLEDAVNAGHEHNEQSPAHRFDNHWAPPSLDPIQSHYHQLPQRSLEQQRHYQRHLGEDCRVKQLYHLCFACSVETRLLRSQSVGYGVGL